MKKNVNFFFFFFFSGKAASAGTISSYIQTSIHFYLMLVLSNLILFFVILPHSWLYLPTSRSRPFKGSFPSRVFFLALYEVMSFGFFRRALSEHCYCLFLMVSMIFVFWCSNSSSLALDLKNSLIGLSFSYSPKYFSQDFPFKNW